MAMMATGLAVVVTPVGIEAAPMDATMADGALARQIASAMQDTPGARTRAASLC